MPKTPAMVIKPHSDSVGTVEGGGGVQSIDGEHMYGGSGETDISATLLSSVVYASRSHRQASNSSSVRPLMNNSVPHPVSPFMKVLQLGTPTSFTSTRTRIRVFKSTELTVIQIASGCGGLSTSELKKGSVVKGSAQQAVVLGMVLKSHGHCTCALAAGKKTYPIKATKTSDETHKPMNLNDFFIIFFPLSLLQL